MADYKASLSPLKTKVIRSQKIAPSITSSSSSTGLDRDRDRLDIPEESDESADQTPPPRQPPPLASQSQSALPRSHTPGHLATRNHSSSHDRRRKPSDLSIRQRSMSASQAASASASSSRPSTATPSSSHTSRPPPVALANGASTNAVNRVADEAQEGAPERARRPSAMRTASAIVGGGQTLAAPSSGSRRPSVDPRRTLGPYVPFPPLQDPKDAPDVPPAPASGMYWSRAMVSGVPHPSLRAHTTTLIGSNIYVFGGCDSRACFSDLYVMDADSFHWSKPYVVGEAPSPLRAMTCTAVGKKLVIFGGGDGPAYYNDVYVLDTTNFRWSRPRIQGDKAPSKRRAHTACLYKNGIYVFGGGDGIRALNDIWRLDVSDVTKMSWRLIAPGDKEYPASAMTRPKARGYHTANMVGGKLIIFGGSDGGECFDDVWVFDVDTSAWKAVSIPITFRRLSHTATIVGSYLFVIGGHDGNDYSNEVLLLNLVTMSWDRRRIYGQPPSGRGYHGSVLHDSRLVVIGGFDGAEVFDDVMILELAVHAYYSQISHFTIEV